MIVHLKGRGISGRMILHRAWRPVAGLGSKKGAGDRDQAVRPERRARAWPWQRAPRGGALGLYLWRRTGLRPVPAFRQWLLVRAEDAERFSDYKGLNRDVRIGVLRG